jgi:hypothetical protein
MPTFDYPSSAELIQIAQEKLPRLTADRAGFNILPMVNQDASVLMWEQLDNFVGLQAARGMNGQPIKVDKTGANRFLMQPGVYGEFEPLDERELTERRQYGTFANSINVEDLVMLAQDKLLNRRLDRMEKIIWDLFTTGTFQVLGPGPNGVIVLHTDTFTTQTFASVVPWSTHATATPLADLRAVRLKHRGRSVDFGAAAEAYANQVTINNMLQNTNAADVYGRRVAGLATANNLQGMNTLFTQDNLPSIKEYDEGYLDETGTFQPFIPDGTVVVVGKRPAGQKVGEYRMTRNANNPGMAPGPYMRVIDRGEDQIPRSIEVHDGHNGGPVLFFGTAVVIMDVTHTGS